MLTVPNFKLGGWKYGSQSPNGQNYETVYISSTAYGKGRKKLLLLREDLVLPSYDDLNILGQSVCSILYYEAYHFIESGGTRIEGDDGTNDKLKYFPFFLSLSGFIDYSKGSYDGRQGPKGPFGNFWSSYTTTTTVGNVLHTYATTIATEKMFEKQYGFSVHCYESQ